MAKIDFEKLTREGKTVIYKDTKKRLTDTDWDLWGKRITDSDDVFVYRKIATFEEAEQYENNLLN